MNCLYKLEGAAPISYEELVSEILKHPSYSDNISDIIFSKEDPQSYRILTEIKSEIHPNISIEFNPNSGEVEDDYGKNHLALSDYIDKSGLITTFDELGYLDQMIANFRKLGHSVDESKELAEQKLSLDRLTGQMAADLHKITRSYFSGAKSVKKLQEFYGDVYSPQVIRNIWHGLNKLEKYFKQTYGENCKIVSNIVVDTKVEDLEKPVAGTIDIVVVDENDQSHIFLVSGSSKDADSLLEIRKTKKDYLLGFFRHILAKKGLNVKNMDLNLVPFQLILDLDNNLTEVVFSEDLVDNRTSSLLGKEENKLLWKFGDFFLDINARIKLVLPKVFNTNSLLLLKEHTSKFFGDRELGTSVYNESIQLFIKDNVKDSNDYSKGRYMIKVKDKYVYIETTEDKFKSAKVREIVSELLLSVQEKSNDFVEHFLQQFDKVLKGSLSINALASKYASDEYILHLYLNLALYIGVGWELDRSRPDLEEAGIIVLRNSNTLQIDLIALRNSTVNLNTNLKLSKGSTILGQFVTNEQATSTENLLRFSMGNVALMLVMDILNSNANNFGDFSIGTIKVFNTYSGEATIATTSELLTSYRKLLQYSNILNNLENLEFASDLDIFINYIKAALNKNLFDYQTSKTIFSELESINPTMRTKTLETLNTVRKKMESKYASKLGSIEHMSENFTNNDLIVFIYTQLCKTILFYEGIPFTLSLLLFKWGSSWKEESALNGTSISNPSTIPDANIRKIVEIARLGMHNMTLEIMDNWESFRNNEVEDLWRAKNYSSSQNITFGNQHHIYENFFVRNPDGTLNSQLILKKPEDLDDPEEAKFLRAWLARMDALRFSSSKEKLEAIENGTYYLIPLIEGSMETKLRETKDPIAKARKTATEYLTYMKEVFLRDENGAYNNDESELIRHAQEEYVVMNRLDASFNPNHRDKLLSEHDAGFWETNLETLYAHYLFAASRKKHMDKVLPAIKSLRLVGQLYGKYSNIDMDNFDKYLQDYMKSHIHNLSILNEEELRILGSVAPLKFIASTLAMGFNANTGIRNLLESIWKVPARISTKFFAKDEMFTCKEWGKAMLAMIEDTADFTSRVTLIEALNQRFRMLDMDANRIADKIKSNKSGLTNTTERLMFWFSVAPDYFNRMSMLIAQMMHDGCWEACSFGKNGFKYNWKEDKRFAVYASGNTQHKDYNKLRGQYLFLLRTFNDENGASLKEGDDVPLPYTTKQITALKDFSDSVFGFYDHDQRAMVERNAIASLFTLFKTYLTAARTMWFLAPGAYNKGETELAIDESTGNPLWLETVKNPDGTEYMLPTTKNTGVPWILSRNSYMEGIYYSLKHMYEDMKSLGWKEMWNQTKENKTRINNLKLVGWHLFVALVLSGLLKAATSTYKEWNVEDKKKNSPTFTSILRDLVVTSGLADLLGCFLDANIFDSITDVSLNAEPASLSIISKFFTSTGDFLFGSKSFESWATTNIGMYRSGKVFIEGVQELSN